MGLVNLLVPCYTRASGPLYLLPGTRCVGARARKFPTVRPEAFGSEGRKGVVHKEYNTHMVLHSLHIPNSQLYVSEPPPEWFGNGPNEVRSLWPTSYVSPNAHCALA